MLVNANYSGYPIFADSSFFNSRWREERDTFMIIAPFIRAAARTGDWSLAAAIADRLDEESEAFLDRA